MRIGFIGTGLISWAHGLSLKALIDAALLDATVGAVHDEDPARAQGFAAVFDAQVVSSATEVAAASDLVWVCTPTSSHRGAVEAAAAAGCAIFCEKPLSTDLASARTLVSVIESAGVPAQSGLVLRAAPVFRALKELVASGSLGRPMAAVFRDDQYFPTQGTYASTWRGDVIQAGGGCLIEHSIHDVDILRFCFGEVSSVAGRTAAFAECPGIEDRATVTLSFTSGFEAHLTSVWHQILSRGSSRRIELFCEEGMVSLSNEWIGPLRIETTAGVEQRPCPPPEWLQDLSLGNEEIGLAVKPYTEAARGCVEAVADGRAPEPSVQEALVAHRIVDAAYQSSDLGGQPVALG